MKFIPILIGLLTFSTAMPSGIGLVHETPSQESPLEEEPPHDVAVVRGLGQSLEARQVPPPYFPAVVALSISGLALTVILFGIVGVLVTEYNDNNKRRKYTARTVHQSFQQWPAYSWVITHSHYATAFDGVQGIDWGHVHHEFPVSFGETIGYELFCVRSGTFTRYGDGGYLNWAYEGHIGSTEGPAGSIVHFVRQT